MTRIETRSPKNSEVPVQMSEFGDAKRHNDEVRSETQVKTRHSKNFAIRLCSLEEEPRPCRSCNSIWLA